MADQQTQPKTADASREHILARLRQEARRRRLMERVHNGIVLGCIAVLLYMSIANPFVRRDWADSLICAVLLTCLIQAVCCIVSGIVRGYMTQTSAVAIATEAGINECVGPLIDVHMDAFQYTDDAAAYEQTSHALARVLNGLQPCDAHLLHDRHWIVLRGLLGGYMVQAAHREEQNDLTLAILRAVEEIGDTEALPQVEKLAVSQHAGKVRDAAQRLLPVLRDLAERHRASESLLRSAGPPEEAATTLVQPAAGSDDTDQQVLVRPTDGANVGMRNAG